MSAWVHERYQILLILCVLFLLSALPTVARSQEENNPADSEAAPEATIVEELVDLEQHPYKTERLVGDQSVGDFVLGPGKIELELEPGESRVVFLTVSNRIGETHIFDIEVEDMTGSRDPNRSVVLLGDDTGPYTLKDYLSVPQRKFTLEHNTRAKIPVTISIPADAEPGGHYGSVLLKTLAVKAQKGDGQDTAPASAIEGRIGSLFFITIPGDVKKEGELKDFSIIPEQRWYEEGPIHFALTYENTGFVHLNPYGELRITNMFGEEVGFVEIDPWFTLPGSVRLREVTWNRDMLYGKYTATAYINRGYDDVIDEVSVSFWVIPWKLALAGFAVLFVILFLIRTFFRTFEFKRKKD